MRVREVSVPTGQVGFRPFAIELTVETPEELAGLWARFNMSGEVLEEAANNAARYRPRSKGPFASSFLSLIRRDFIGKKDVYKLLTSKLKEHGIRRR